MVRTGGARIVAPARLRSLFTSKTIFFWRPFARFIGKFKKNLYNVHLPKTSRSDRSYFRNPTNFRNRRDPFYRFTLTSDNQKNRWPHKTKILIRKKWTFTTNTLNARFLSNVFRAKNIKNFLIIRNTNKRFTVLCYNHCDHFLSRRWLIFRCVKRHFYTV